ncbi:OLC1v1008248C1 [Oldenlandia corymbosa var. corymbosa]|uniref:OLC1v1008248C1 n=1 Tax=Oldenlandia corymbosa var. corymbosa TaxID=529605 RepID=A0AAV1DMM8_OLDCO|nr:OLC1v1008248C1 [Oldenlandia corymbosa var. corymbosa]
MGGSPSKRVYHALKNSPEFNSACESVFQTEVALAQHAFAGIKPYQLFSAAERLHQALVSNSSPVPLIKKWAPSPPTREQVDRALKSLQARLRESGSGSGQEVGSKAEVVLGDGEFKEFSVDVFSDVVVSNARNEVLKRVPVGIAGIAGVGMVVRPGREVVGTVIGVYAIGVATAVYLSLND